LGRRCRPGSLRGLRSAGLPVRRCDLRRLHQARRHGDVPGSHRPGDGARAKPRRAGAVVLRGDTCVQPAVLPARIAGPARIRGRVGRPRRRLGLPALPRRARRPFGAIALPPRRTNGGLAPCPRTRRLPRGASGAAVRLRALGRRQGSGGRRARGSRSGVDQRDVQGSRIVACTVPTWHRRCRSRRSLEHRSGGLARSRLRRHRVHAAPAKGWPEAGCPCRRRRRAAGPVAGGCTVDVRRGCPLVRS